MATEEQEAVVVVEPEIETEAGTSEEAPPSWEDFTEDGQVVISYRFEMVPLNKLFVDYHEELMNGTGQLHSKSLAYQRKQEKIAKQIIQDGVNPDLFGTLIVNRREDGSFAVVDGGTRYRALMGLKTPPEVLVPCLVFEWNDDREIRNYVALNKERSGLTQVDIFVAEVKYGDETATAIQDKLIAETGHGVGYGKDSWQCVHALKQAHKHERLTWVLVTLRRCGWLEMKGGRTQTTVGAVDRLLKLGVDPDVAAEKWRGLTPVGLMNEAKAQKDIAGASRSIARIVALILAQIYNKGKRGTARVDTAKLTPQIDDDEE